MSELPKFVEFHEEGPREGFQIEKTHYPLERRAALIDALSESGLKQIQVGSFVSPKAVPTMADTADLFKAIKRNPDVRYTALWLNKKGFELAKATPEADMYAQIMFYASDAFSRANNNCSAEEMRDRQANWLEMYIENGLEVKNAYFMTAFGCNYSGEVPLSAVTDYVKWWVALCHDRDVKMPALYLADTVGWANPEEIKRRVGAVRELAPEARIGLHLHDTRGLGSANVYAALQMGVDLFDSSVAGLGGCPFSNHGDYGASGNVCTEDMVFMCQEMGIDTGIDLDALIEAACLAEDIIGRRLYGSIMHSGSLMSHRARAT